jgi:lipopolysaccharide transport system ATP-binding protein
MAASNVAIRVEGLGKCYRIGAVRARYRTLRDALAAAWPSASRAGGGDPAAGSDDFWALRDVSFEVARGEVIGIIGRNGAGKSTLLKILSRITEPTSGFADIYGRVGSLLEVGTGFHPELTGRENIFLNGAILGMRRQEIERKFDEIVAFAEVERFVDTAVKHYSTGMHLRLAFGVAAHLEPDILMVDEVLAVGDAEFQRKCLGKMNDVAQHGRTVLLVSHDMTAVAHLATRCLWLDAGRIVRAGTTERVIREYTQRNADRVVDLASRMDRRGDGVIRLQSISFLDGRGEPVHAVGSGAPVTIAVTYTSHAAPVDPRDVWLDMTFRDGLGHPVATLSTRFGSIVVDGPSSGELTLNCHVPSLSLADESYSLDLWLAYRHGLSDQVLRAADLLVTPSNYFGTGHAPVKRKHGAGLIQHRWTVSAAAAQPTPAGVR